MSSCVASQPPPAIGLLTTENARPSANCTVWLNDGLRGDAFLEA